MDEVLAKLLPEEKAAVVMRVRRSTARGDGGRRRFLLSWLYWASGTMDGGAGGYRSDAAVQWPAFGASDRTRLQFANAVEGRNKF
jgi:hypothetical protein